MRLILAALLSMCLLVGCACPEKIALREAMDGATKPIRDDHKVWAAALKVDPTTGKDHRDQLPQLTQRQYDNMMKAHAEYEGLVQDDRAHDSIGAP